MVGCADEVYQELEEVEEDGVVLVLEDCATFDDCADALEDFPPPEPVEPSNTTKFAFPPLGGASLTRPYAALLTALFV